MYKSKKKKLSIILLALFIFNLVPINNISVQADEITETIDSVYVNPVYEEVVDQQLIAEESANVVYSTAQADDTFTSISKAAEFLKESLIQREACIKFKYKSSSIDGSLFQTFFDAAVEETDTSASNEGDYLAFNVVGYSGSASISSAGYAEFTFYPCYLTTYEQEMQVTSEIKNILDELNVYYEDEYTKIKAVHDYIVDNVEYDYSLEKFSTYNAIIEKSVVCQGFASLTYRMLRELNVGVRCIRSTDHAWNIVEIDGLWYNVDNTWDENYSTSYYTSYRWFLKEESDFSNHPRISQYTTSEFNSKYIMSSESYTNAISMQSDVENLYLVKGDSFEIQGIFYPYTKINNKIEWSSSDESVAKLSTEGVGYDSYKVIGYQEIKAVKAGSAVITASSVDGTLSKTINVVVTDSDVGVKSIILNESNIELIYNNYYKLSAIASPSNATNNSFTWKSSNSSVVSVDENGRIYGVSVGNAVITAYAEDGKVSSSCNVTVKYQDIQIEKINFAEESISLKAGESTINKVLVIPYNVDTTGIKYSSSNTNIATVDSNGNITAISAGTATITVASSDMSKTAVCTVKVTGTATTILVTSVSLNKTSLYLETGKSSTLTATISPSNATNKDVTWESSNTKVATVDSNGKVTAVSAGSAIITVITKNGSYTAECKVTVSDPNVSVTGVTLNKSTLSIEKGKTSSLTATIKPSNATNKNVTWKSSDTKIATVDSNGKVTAVAVGTATITVTTKDGSKKAECKVTVLNSFGTLKVNSVNKNSTKITGTGTKGAKVTAYVSGKSIGSATVASNGSYSISISKQSSGKEVTIKMTKSGYASKSVTTTVQNVFSSLKVNTINKNSTKITGTGTKGAKVTAYVSGKSIGSATVDSKGNYSIKISKQSAGKVVTIKMTKSGYVSKSVNSTVQNVFSTFTVSKISKSTTKVTGKGTKGATVKVYVNNKVIGTATVGSNGKYSVKIAKQKKGVKVTVKMSKSGYSTVSKTVTVS